MPLILALILSLLRPTLPFLIQPSSIPAVTNVKIDGLDPAKYARAGEVGLVLAIDHDRPLFSWAIPPPRYSHRGLKVNGSIVRLYAVDDSDDKIEVGKIVWNSKFRAGESTQMQYDGKYRLIAGSRYCVVVQWKSYQWRTKSYRWSPPSKAACFDRGIGVVKTAAGHGNDDDVLLHWAPSSWIGDDNMKIYRSNFTVPEELLANARKVRVYVSGLAWAQIYVNGQKVSKRERLGVGWSRYDKTCFYATYEILPIILLKSLRGVRGRTTSDNVIGVMIGQGWRNQAEFPPLFNTSSSHADAAPHGSNSSNGKSPAEMPSYTARALRLIVKLKEKKRPTPNDDNDGRNRIIGSSGYGGDWHTIAYTNNRTWIGAQGPYLSDSAYDGVTYDARIAEDFRNFSSPNYRVLMPSIWSSSSVADISNQSWAISTKLKAQPIPPIRDQKALKPVKVLLVSKNNNSNTAHFVVDFGQNLAGVCRIRLPTGVKRGHRVTFKHAEAIMHQPYGDFGENGTEYLYYLNLLEAKATDVYIFSGHETEGKEAEEQEDDDDDDDDDDDVKGWVPSSPSSSFFTFEFTYHGFRYVEIIGWPISSSSHHNDDNDDGDDGDEDAQGLEMITLPEIELVHFRSNVDRIGHFSSKSVPLLSSFFEMAAGTLGSNLMSVLTDCPQRSERLGWMGDAGSSADMAALSYQMEAFHGAYFDRIRDEMMPNGTIPDVVPFYKSGRLPADPSWSSAFIFMLSSRYRMGGDITPYIRHREMVKRYMESVYISVEQQGGLEAVIENNLSWGYYGDWLPANTTEAPPVTYVSIFNWIVSLYQATELALGAGDTKNGQVYAENATDVSKTFVKYYFNQEKAIFGGGGQTELSLGLRLNILDASSEERVVDKLISKINDDDGGKLSVGMFGFKYIFQQLLKRGFTDKALQLLMQKTEPSIGYMHLNDNEPAETNMWEKWDANTGWYGGSRNHHMYSTLGTFLYEIAGLAANQEKTVGSSFADPLRLSLLHLLTKQKRVVPNTRTTTRSSSRTRPVLLPMSDACFQTHNANGNVSFCWSIDITTERQQEQQQQQQQEGNGEGRGGEQGDVKSSSIFDEEITSGSLPSSSSKNSKIMRNSNVVSVTTRINVTIPGGTSSLITIPLFESLLFKNDKDGDDAHIGGDDDNSTPPTAVSAFNDYLVEIKESGVLLFHGLFNTQSSPPQIIHDYDLLQRVPGLLHLKSRKCGDDNDDDDDDDDDRDDDDRDDDDGECINALLLNVASGRFSFEITVLREPAIASE